MDIAINVEDIWYRYPGCEEYILRGVNVNMYSSNIYLIVGENGSGKTTLLMVLAGLLKPTKGDVKINSISIFSKNTNIRRYIGLLFQNPELMLFNPTVYEELTYSIKQIEDDEKVIESRLRYWLEYFGIDNSILKKKTHTLSYGYKKLIALISILIYSPPILLLDEPHAGLAKRYTEKLCKLVVDHKRLGGIAIITSHSLGPYIGVFDIVFKLKSGTLVKLGSSKDLANRS